MFREILLYVMFLWVLYVISFSNLNSDSYLFQKHIKNEFIPSGVSDELKTVSNRVLFIFLASLNMYSFSDK